MHMPKLRYLNDVEDVWGIPSLPYAKGMCLCMTPASSTPAVMPRTVRTRHLAHIRYCLTKNSGSTVLCLLWSPPMSCACCPDASPLKLNFRLEARKYSTRVILRTDGRDEHIFSAIE